MDKVKKKGPTTLETLKELISRHREFDIIDLFSDMHPADIADLIDELEEEDRLQLFSLLDVEKASDVILELSDSSREQIIEDLSNEKLTDIIEEMESDDKADIIAELSDDQAKAVLDAIEPEAVSYTHLRAHETVLEIVCRLLLVKKNIDAKAQITQQYYRLNNTQNT